MRLDTLRMIVGFSIISSHLLCYFLLLATKALTTQEKMELSLLVSPIFAVYVTAIVRRFTGSSANFDSDPTHPALRILSIGSSTIFSISVPLIVLQFTRGEIADFGSLKTTLGLVETALGVYTGAVIDRLFGAAKVDREDSTNPPSGSAPGSGNATGLIETHSKI